MITKQNIINALKSIDFDLQLINSGNVSHQLPAIRQNIEYLIEQLTKVVTPDIVLELAVKSCYLESTDEIMSHSQYEQNVFARALFVVYCVRNKLLTITEATKKIGIPESNYYKLLAIYHAAESEKYRCGEVWLNNFNSMIYNE